MRLLRLTSLLLAALAISACSSSGGGGATPLTPATYVGTWSGTWTNTTFASTGAVNVTVTESGGQLTFAFDMDGNVFGGSNPPAENFTATINTNDATLAATTSSTYGTVTAKLNGDGSFTINGTAIPGSVDTFSLTGTWNATTITANVTITFDGGTTAPANGTATLTKV
ncbi:MAG TPA: hypothetical protein ENI87_13940 [bacterium]|nr:hypothetical protein [bacterium]